jgi:hypothetical protein
MIHHISIAALNPQHVAQVLAEIWQGETAPFPVHAGSYVVLALDEYGTMIEIYPAGTEMHPGANEEEVIFEQTSTRTAFSPNHAAVSVPTYQERIEAIAAREGWRAVRCDRDGFFEVIELWIENRQLMELLPPDLALKYLSFMQPESLKAFLSAGATA